MRTITTRYQAWRPLAPAEKHAVHLLRADDLLLGRCQRDRVEDEGPRLRAAEPAVERDQLLERAALVEIGVVEAADHEVGDVGETVRAQQVMRRVRRRTARAGRRRRRAPARGSGCRPRRVRPLRALASGARTQPTWGCSRSAGSRPRVLLLDLLERQPLRLVHEVDEPEVAGAEHDDLSIADLVLLRLRRRARRLPDGLATPSTPARRRP